MLETIAEMIGQPDSKRFWYQFTVKDGGELIPDSFKIPLRPTTTILDVVKQDDVPPVLVEWINLTEKRRHDTHNIARVCLENHAKCMDAYRQAKSKAAYVDKITESMRNEIAEQKFEIKKLKAEHALQENRISSLFEQLLEARTQNRLLQKSDDGHVEQPTKRAEPIQAEQEQERETPKDPETDFEPVPDTKETTTGEELSNIIAYLKGVNVEQDR